MQLTISLEVKIIAKAFWPSLAMVAYSIICAGKVVSTTVLWVTPDGSGGGGGLDLAA